MATSRRLLLETKRDAFIQEMKRELQRKGKSAPTKKNYTFRLGQFLDFQGVNVERTTKKDITKYLSKFVRSAKKDPKSRAALLQAGASISFFFKYVVEKPALRDTTREIIIKAR